MAVKKTTDSDAKERIRIESAEPAGEAMKKAERTTPDRTKMIYIGPSLPKAVLKENSIFDGTKEEILKQLASVFQKYPIAEKLLVPVDRLAWQKDRMKTAGNLMNKYYSDLASVISASYGKGD